MVNQTQASTLQTGSAAVADKGRRQRIEQRLRRIWGRLIGEDAERADPAASFLELGADSLLLLQASQHIRAEFGLAVPFRDLLERVPTLQALTDLLDRELPAEAAEDAPADVPAPRASTTPRVAEPPAAAAQPGPAEPPGPWPDPVFREAPNTERAAWPPSDGLLQSDDILEQVLGYQLQIVEQQLQLSFEQLALLGQAGPGHNGSGPSPAAESRPPTAPPPQPPNRQGPAAGQHTERVPASRDGRYDPPPYVAYQPPRPQTEQLTPRQQRHLEDLAARLGRQFRKSKQLAQESRLRLADNRASTGFRQLYKEIFFPIFVEKGQGTQVWDVDGNQLLDLVMGYGTLVFGHSPSFVVEAMRRQSDLGLRIGLEPPESARAAQLICELTGNERAAFTNSGTEAVMAAIRLARTCTGRTKIAMFQGGYHGFFDEVMVISAPSHDGRPSSLPMAPGVSPHVSENVLVLEYCSPRSIDILQDCGHQLAAVLVEPQQARRPGMDMQEFLQELRRVTQETGAALILDEVITGFRIHPGGAQAVYGVRADMATYGKGVGAGIPVGVVSGKKEFLDGLDGGVWNYGDDSYPMAEATFLAGTYFKHPYTIPAICAVLEEYKKQGPELQEGMARRTARLSQRLNQYFESEQLPIRMKCHSSICRPVFSREVRHSGLFYYHLLENGLYVREGRSWFISAVHGDEDFDRVLQAVGAGVEAMRAGGFLPGGPTPAPSAGSRQDEPPPADPRSSGPAAVQSAAAPPEAAAKERRVVPATLAQQELWLLAQMGEDAARAYIEGLTLRLRGPLQLEALASALQTAADRHEALRAAFGPRGETLEIVSDMTLDIPVHELSHLDSARREERLAELLEREAGGLFDLSERPLYRVRLFRLGRQEHVLDITFHHSVLDGLSNGMILGEIRLLYEARCRNRELRLPNPLPFSDFACWQREQQQEAGLQAAEAFWLGQFADKVPLLELPTDRRRTSRNAYAGRRQILQAPKPLLDDLRRAGARQGRTLFTVLMGAVNILLHRLSGQDDIVVGASAAGQALMGAKGLAGHCVNLVPLRSRIQGEQTFSEYLQALQTGVLDAWEHQNYPFSRLLQKLKLPADPRRTQLLSAVMNVDRGSLDQYELWGLQTEAARHPCRGAKFDILLDIEVGGRAILVHCDYRTALFDESTIRRWLSHLRALMEGIALDPLRRPWEFPLLPQSARHQLLHEWGGTELKFPSGCAHHLFEAQAEHGPDRVALTEDEELRQVSYGELEARSNLLSQRLLEQGAGPESLVGILLEDGASIVTGILAILKAGAAYVPLDPSYPPQRLAFSLQDSRSCALLSCPSLADRLPEGDPPKVFAETAFGPPAGLPAGRSAGGACPENAAYVIYTSGSTGRPKGVVVSHRNLTRLLRATEHLFGFHEGDVWTLFHSCAFDFSVWEIWGALAYGGRLATVPRWKSRSPRDFLELLRRQSVTVLNQTPSAFSQLAQAEVDLPAPDSLRLVVFGGEALDPSGLKPWFERHSEKVRLFNMYGITETTVHVTFRLLRPDDARRPASPIGAPLPDLQLYILDRRLLPVPIGAAGELFVGGEGPARGYLRRPGLTADRFVPHHFSTSPGERLYRTGDSARWLPEGDIQFLGRLDRQVKVRGFRIELGEIEAALRRHPDVKDAAALIRNDPSGDGRLIAYAASGNAGPKLEEELRDLLKQRLPAHMLPAFLIPLESFPLTPNGKLDRTALPEPQGERPRLKEAYLAPRSGLERIIAGAWREVLGIEKVGLEDNFFDLGGHSLLMIRLQAKLEEALHRKVPIVDLFEFTTVRSLAGRLGDEGYRAEAGIEAPAQQAVPSAASTVVAASAAPEAPQEIAVIGMAGRFPGARNVEEFWRNLCAGVESISFFSDDELKAAGVPEEAINDPDYVRASAVLEGADLFDAFFFDINPREAQVMNPQHRIFLECSWEALENAGYDPFRYPGLIGVFGGESDNAYYSYALSDRQALKTAGRYLIGLGNWSDHLTTRVSYKLNLKGPSFHVRTACSTSLVAVHLACQSLRQGECDMALAGGVSVAVPQRMGYFVQGRPFSRDGHCYAFDARAKGAVFGSGCGLVVLKPLRRALEDGDCIRAVIKGSAINNDGSAKAGYIAPSVQGQAEAIVRALERGRIDPHSVSYIEAHGTGTEVGDPIEIRGLQQAFRQAGANKKGYCAIASLKTNVGHLDAAAGAAGLIKAVLALQHSRLPPSLNFETPNPEIDFEDSPFYVNTRLREWTSEGAPLRAGVSSLGVGGTNAHVVLEEAPAGGAAGRQEGRQLLALSAKSRKALGDTCRNLASHLRSSPGLDLADAAYTLQTGRRELRHRRFAVCSDLDDACQVLEKLDPRRVFSGEQEARDRPCAFLFPGLGHHYVGMGRELYDRLPVFRRVLDECFELVRHRLDLAAVLYPADSEAEQAACNMERMEAAQAAQFAVEYGLARQWMEWGIRPQAMIGHSMGEYVAACLAGVFPLQDALRLVLLRGRLMEKMAPGAMMAVALPESELLPLLDGEVSLALVNAPSLCAVSGDSRAVSRLEQRLSEKGIECRRLHVPQAAHSHLLDPFLEEFGKEVASIELHPPKLPCISNLSGSWMTAQEAAEPSYWVRHLRQTVRFSQGLGRLIEEAPEAVLLEVGPGNALGSLVRQHPAAAGMTVVSSMRHPKESQSDHVFLLHSLGQLWLAGTVVRWEALHNGPRRRVPLPSYPFERVRFWVQPGQRPLPGRPKGDQQAEGMPSAAQEAEQEDSQPLHRRPGLSTEFAPPQSQVEMRIAGIWQEVLGIREVGLHDDFFQLGGHSLIAARILARLRETFRMDLPLRDFFDAATVAGLAAKVGDAVVGRVLEEDGPQTQGEPGGGLRKEGANEAPLSFAQQRLWFLDQLMSGNPFYNFSMAWRLTGILEAPSLEAALNEIVRRHEALRTRFSRPGEEPAQYVLPARKRRLPLVDLSRLGSRGDAELMQACIREVRRPFELARGPLLRPLLFRLGEQQHCLQAVIHHIVSDAWSMGLFGSELSALYSAFRSRRPSPLPDLPVQYSDFARWQRRRLQGEALEVEISYWRRRLEGAPVLDFPTDRPRLAVQRFRGGSLGLAFPAPLSRSLRSIGRSVKATSYMTLLTAFQTLLHRYTGQTDLVAGTPVANRSHPATEKLIGFFVNTLAMRTDASGDPSFQDLLQRVSRQALDDYAHLDVPFEKLLDYLQAERDLSRNPIFQLVFALQNVPAEDGKGEGMGGLQVRKLIVDSRTTRFDIEVHLRESPEGIRGVLFYDRDLFDRTTIVRFTRHFRRLLEGIAANPQTRISRLSLMSPAEQSQMLREWNPGSTAFSADLCLDEPFQAQAAIRPHGVAVICRERHLSYGELDRRSSLLACRLAHLGVGPEVRAGVCLQRSPLMATALLGVLKAGGAYVPIDPQYPAQRIGFILKDVRAPVVLVRSPSVGPDLKGMGAAPLYLDQFDWGARPAANPPVRKSSDQSAYVIFTSGSTGLPKGVILQHRPVINLIEWVNRTYRVGPDDCVLLVASICFDLSVYDIFGMLSAGGTVLAAADSEIRDAARLVEILDSGRVTFWDSAPPALQQLVPFFPPPGRGSRSLRLAFLSGDWIPLTLPTALKKAFPRVQVIGLGGATEAAIWSNFHPIRQIRPGWSSIPYGRAIPNAAYYVLDPSLQPAPMGCPGDLHIGGECLSLGYFNRPGLTASKYVPDPFGQKPGGVLYATGDRARWRAEGLIEFLGRRDSQVKVRGYRVELGEIEAALAEEEGFEQCAVLMREDQPGVKRLAAYLVPKDRKAVASFDPAQLRDSLKEKLPPYMVPAAFVVLEELPLTPNGKLDRRALPPPGQGLAAEKTERILPRTPAEKQLARIWAEALQLEEVGVEDNFFDLGGDSILSIQIVTRARQVGFEITTQHIFEHQTVAELAALAKTGRQRPTAPRKSPQAEEPEAPASEPLGADPQIEEQYPLSPMQQAMLTHSLAFAEGDVNYMQFHWLLPQLDVPSFKWAWQQLAQRHPVLRTAFRWEGSARPLQAVFRHCEIPFEEQDWADASPREQQERLEALLLENRRRRFRLDRPPLTRLTLVRLGEERHQLVWGIHHSLVDGWCVARLFQEVFDIYKAFRQGRAIESAPPPPYRRYIEWLQERDWGAAKAFWRKFVHGLCSPAPLWIDKLCPGCASEQEGAICQTLVVPSAVSEALRSLAQSSRVTLSTLLYGAWAILLSRYSGQQDVAFGITVSGRPADLEGVESMIGLFMNNLPVQVKVPGEARLVDWLKQLQSRLAEMQQYEYTPEHKIRQWLGLPDGMPLYESLLVFGNFPNPTKGREVTEAGEAEGWRSSRSRYFGAMTSSPLSVFSEPGKRIPLRFIYSCGRFEDSSIRRLMRHLGTLLQSMAERPDLRLGELPMFSPAERHALLLERDASLDGRLKEVLKGLGLPDAFRSACREGLPIRLLDAQSEPVPDGVPAEVCLGGLPGAGADSPGGSDERPAAAPSSGRSGACLYRTGMAGRFRSSGRLELLGSLQGAALIRGRTVWPRVVESVLSEHPAVRRCAVTVRRDPPGLAAHICWKAEAPTSLAALQSFLKERLPTCMLPADFAVCQELPLTSSGEADRQALQRSGASQAWGSKEAFLRNYLFQDAMEARLVQIWEETFGMRPLSPSDDFFELGGNSVLAVSLAARIQERLGLDLPLSVLFEGATIKGLAGLLQRQAGELPWSSLVAIKPGGDRRPFFCVHAAGGNVVGFNQLVRHITPDQPFYGLQSAGLDGRQEPDRRVEDMAARYIKDIRGVQERGPYLLGGVSFGGYVAFEMARQLSQAEEPVPLLVLFDTWAPVAGGKPALAEMTPEDGEVLAWLAREASRLYGEEVSIPAQAFRALAPEKRADYALEQMRLCGAVPEAGLEHTRRLMQIHLASLQAQRDYVAAPYGGRITIFKAEKESSSSLSKHPARGTPQLYQGWRGLAAALEVHTVPGDHTTMILEPNVRLLARALTECLNRAQRD